MKIKHAHQAGSVTPVHPKKQTTKNRATGALQGTTAAHVNQHPDFASLEQSAPAMAHPIKAKLMHCAAWLALVLGGVA